MTNDDTWDLSRRKLLGTAGTIGAAGALGGAATTSLLWDQEQFGNADNPNILQAGALDLAVDWEVRYFDWIDATDRLLAQQELVKDGPGGDSPNDQPGPIIDLDDVKPGDVVEATLSAHIFGNPAFLGVHYQEHTDADNGMTEPEDKVNGHDPDNSDGDPFVESGFGAAAGALLAGAMPENLLGGEAESTDGGVLSRKNFLRSAAAAGAGAVGMGAMTGTVGAAVGDELGEVTLPGHESDAQSFFCGVGGAFDGSHYVTPKEGDGDCASTVIQIFDPPSSGDGAATLVSEKDIVDPDGNSVTISTNAWDPGRGKFWASRDGEVYLIDLGDKTDGSVDAVAEPQFTANPANFGLVDGLAYDGVNDNVLYSGDVDDIVEIYDATTGSETADSPITPMDANGNTLGEISGVATGAAVNGRPTMYVGQNPGPDNGNIYRVFADTGEFISAFQTGTGFRVEDITCDPVTYAPAEAILVKDARAARYKAFEVESGTCPVGGTPDDGGDGELDDVMECVIWHDNGDNFPDEITDRSPPTNEAELEQYLMDLTNGDIAWMDNDQLVFQGTLADLHSTQVTLNAQNAVVSGEDGDAVADAFPESWCYQNSVTEYVGILCWVPRDIPGIDDNVIQTDRLEFEFGFNAIQCRHNVADDGGPIDETLAEADGADAAPAGQGADDGSGSQQ